MTPRKSCAANLLTKDNARRIAASIAKLPELLKARRHAEHQEAEAISRSALGASWGPQGDQGGKDAHR